MARRNERTDAQKKKEGAFLRVQLEAYKQREGLKHDEVAARLKISPSMLTGMAKGEKTISDKWRLDFAIFFGFDATVARPEILEEGARYVEAIPDILLSDPVSSRLGLTPEGKELIRMALKMAQKHRQE